MCYAQRIYGQLDKQTNQVYDDERGGFSTDIDTETSPTADRSGQNRTSSSAEALRRRLFEGGGGSLRVLGRMSDHRGGGGRTPKAGPMSSGAGLSELLCAYPDVIKVGVVGDRRDAMGRHGELAVL